jgi:hypothetical protein
VDTENTIETPEIFGICELRYERRDAIVTNVWLIEILNAPCVPPDVVYENEIEVLTFANWTGISRDTREIRVTFRSGCCSGNDATKEDEEPDTGM